MCSTSSPCLASPHDSWQRIDLQPAKVCAELSHLGHAGDYLGHAVGHHIVNMSRLLIHMLGPGLEAHLEHAPRSKHLSHRLLELRLHAVRVQLCIN